MTPLTAIVALADGYLLGSIPFGIVFTRLAGTQDIRAIGSGNIGATNVLRTGRKGLAAATLVCDALKGTAAVLLAAHFAGHEAALAAGLGAFLGVLFAVAWQGALVFGVLWLAVAAATRYSSLASLVACAAVPVYFWLTGAPREALVFLLLAILTFVMHRANINRLRQGTEGKIGQKAGA